VSPVSGIVGWLSSDQESECPHPNQARPHRRSSGTSASSRTSTTASPRWPTACCSSPVWSTGAPCGRSTWTRWTSSVSAASPSSPRPSGCRGRSTAPTTCWTWSTPPATSTSPMKCPGRWPPVRARSCW